MIDGGFCKPTSDDYLNPILYDDNDEKDDDKYVNDDDNNDDYDDDDDDGSGVSDAHIHGDRDYGDAIEDDDQNWVWMVMMQQW